MMPFGGNVMGSPIVLPPQTTGYPQTAGYSYPTASYGYGMTTSPYGYYGGAYGGANYGASSYPYAGYATYGYPRAASASPYF